MKPEKEGVLNNLPRKEKITVKWSLEWFFYQKQDYWSNTLFSLVFQCTLLHFKIYHRLKTLILAEGIPTKFVRVRGLSYCTPYSMRDRKYSAEYSVEYYFVRNNRKRCMQFVDKEFSSSQESFYTCHFLVVDFPIVPRIVAFI